MLYRLAATTWDYPDDLLSTTAVGFSEESNCESNIRFGLLCGKRRRTAGEKGQTRQERNRPNPKALPFRIPCLHRIHRDLSFTDL